MIDHPSPFTDLDIVVGTGDVVFEESTDTVDGEPFERISNRSKTLNGTVVVGVLRNRGEVLLIMLDGSHGWTLPFGPVAADEDWTDTAVNTVSECVRLPVSINDVLKVRRKRHEFAGDHVIAHDVVVSAAPQPDASHSLSPQDAVRDTDWFESPPTDTGASKMPQPIFN